MASTIKLSIDQHLAMCARSEEIGCEVDILVKTIDVVFLDLFMPLLNGEIGIFAQRAWCWWLRIRAGMDRSWPAAIPRRV